MGGHDRTVAGDLANHLERRADAIDPPRDEIRSYAHDPVQFARNVLGIDPWSRQRDILRAALTHERVAVSSGNKNGKSTAVAILALWYYCSFPGVRVILMATTDRQVNRILWREIKRLARNARFPIPGVKRMGKRAQTGLTSDVLEAEIFGFTASEKEAVAGISGGRMLWIVDEASGVADDIYEAIEGNRAGGNVRVFLISNPTQTEGEFFEAFGTKSEDALGRAGYRTFQLDSRNGPNVTGEWRELEEWSKGEQRWRKRTTPIPGLAAPEWIAAKAIEWGEDSPEFCVRVKGEFVSEEEAKIFTLALLAAAQQRWEDTEAVGRLQIGLDPAGDSGEGDETAACVRRGPKMLALVARRGLNADAIAVWVGGLVLEHSEPHEPALPLVAVDYEGDVGPKVWRALEVYLIVHPRAFELVRVRASERAVRKPRIFDRIRDELWANGRDWCKEGGAIIEDARLERELRAPEFELDIRGRTKATPKRELRKILGRSTDRADAFLLSVWEPLSARVAEDRPPPAHEDFGGADPDRALDPFEADRAWRY